eukprot:1724146-Rhodomonas_salina.4
MEAGTQGSSARYMLGSGTRALQGAGTTRGWHERCLHWDTECVPKVRVSVVELVLLPEGLAVVLLVVHLLAANLSTPSSVLTWKNQHFHQTQVQAYKQQFYYQQEQEQLLYRRYSEQIRDEREEAFISGYHFGSNKVLSSPYPGGECFVHPLLYGPDSVASAPFPRRAKTSFVNAAAMSNSPGAGISTLHQLNLSSRPSIFADGSPVNTLYLLKDCDQHVHDD